MVYFDNDETPENHTHRGEWFYKIGDAHRDGLSSLKNNWCRMAWFTIIMMKALTTTPTCGCGFF